MRKTKTERRTVSVNVETPADMIQWIDAEAAKHETGRSGVFRLAVKKMMEESIASQQENGGVR